MIALIGVGASGEVYLADDTQLRRQVAVKVLHRVLADDEVFLERFRSEARMAAGLNHPNVLAVHDWGEDEVPFLVTEYLGGGSLRAMLDQSGPLTPSQTLLIALEATRGLEYAHKRGVVQRDIKPGNLLFDSEGHVRIADFGLAKALAEASATEPGGTVLGTVRYASPEQAQGQRLSAASDIYSLGLVMVEAITGSLPYDVDTTIGTLMARVETPVETDERFASLRGPVERATRIDPDERPDAGEFHVALMAAAEGLPRPEPLPLAGAISFDPLQVSNRDRTMIGAGPAEEAIPEPDVDDSRRGRRKAAKAAAVKPAGGDEQRGRRRWPWMLLMALLIAGAGVGVWAAQTESGAPTRIVPEARGMTEQDFRDQVDGFWALDIAADREDGTEPGTVLRTDPPAGTELAEGGLVTYWVSQGNQLKSVPTNLVGLTVEDATVWITGAELTLGEISRQSDEEAPAGVVIEVLTVDPQIPGGDPVDLLVSSGPDLRTVPDSLVGGTFEEAESQLAVLRLVAVRGEDYSNDVEEGLVISVDPPAGTEVERDSEVTVVVSLGREPVEVPNVTGLDPGVAADILVEAGFCISDTVGPPNTSVLVTEPQAGTIALYGSCIRIVTTTN